MSARPDARLRLAEVLAALSLETDLGMGHPPEEAIRTCLLAAGLAGRVGLVPAEVADTYWTALLMHVGCTAFAHEQAALFGGDEIAVNAIGSKTDFGNFREALAFLLELGRPMPPVRRARVLLMGLASGERFGRQIAAATCEVATSVAPRLRLSSSVQRALHEMFERWDAQAMEHRGLGRELGQARRLRDGLARQLLRRPRPPPFRCPRVCWPLPTSSRP